MASNFKKVVVKVGTNVLTRDDGRLDVTSISHLVDQLAEFKKEGALVILVSSGAVAAGRELVEETGYAAATIDFIMEGPTSAGMSNEILAFVRARKLTRVESGGGDETEDITVHEVPRKDAARWLVRKMTDGYSVDPKMFAGLFFLEHEDLMRQA